MSDSLSPIDIEMEKFQRNDDEYFEKYCQNIEGPNYCEIGVIAQTFAVTMINYRKIYSGLSTLNGLFDKSKSGETKSLDASDTEIIEELAKLMEKSENFEHSGYIRKSFEVVPSLRPLYEKGERLSRDEDGRIKKKFNSNSLANLRNILLHYEVKKKTNDGKYYLIFSHNSRDNREVIDLLDPDDVESRHKNGRFSIKSGNILFGLLSREYVFCKYQEVFPNIFQLEEIVKDLYEKCEGKR